MLDRSSLEGRVVSPDQVIASDRGAAAAVSQLYRERRADPRIEFAWLANSSAGVTESGHNLAVPFDYTEIRKALHAILDSELRAGRIKETTWQKIHGERRPG
jgi:hypothetical protein